MGERNGSDCDRSRSPVPQGPKVRAAKDKVKEISRVEKQAGMEVPVVLPKLAPIAATGWTAHNTEVLKQHSAYMDLEVASGTVSSDERTGFLQSIRDIIESEDGENKRVAAEAVVAAKLERKAKSFKEAFQQQPTLDGINFAGGKGKGKGNSQFPHGTNPGRYTAIPHNSNTTEVVRAIKALSGRAHAAQDEANQRQQIAAVGNA